MTGRIIRVYADTSVFGGAFDAEFDAASQTFLSQVRSGRFRLVTSAIVQEELSPAPTEVQNLFNEMLELMEVADISEDVLELRSAYLNRTTRHWYTWLAIPSVMLSRRRSISPTPRDPSLRSG